MSEPKKDSPVAAVKLERGGIPLYYQLEQIIRSRISSGEISPDEPFPTELELCKKYEVSRAVVRQAFASLMHDGLINRIPGKGTFLAPQKSGQGVLHCFNTIEELVAFSKKTTNVIRFKGLATPSSHVASLLNLKAGDKVYSIRGVRRLDDRALCYFVISLPGEFAPFFTGEKLDSGAILSVVERKSGLVVQRVQQIIRASRAPKHVGKYLDLDEGDPVLVFERTYYADDDRVIETGISYFHPDRYHYVMDFAHEK